MGLWRPDLASGGQIRGSVPEEPLGRPNGQIGPDPAKSVVGRPNRWFWSKTTVFSTLGS